MLRFSISAKRSAGAPIFDQRLQLAAAKVMDPNLPFQHMTPRRALAELAEVRSELVSAGKRSIELVSRPTPLQAKVLQAFGVDTSGWGKATIA